MLSVHQIFLTSNPIDFLPDKIEEATESVKKFFPGNRYRYKFYVEEDIQNLIKDNFAPVVLECYNKLKSYAFKADLARYCILYLYGGWYFDITIRCLTDIQLNNKIKIFGFRDTNRYIGNTNAVDNCVIYASKPKQLVFLDAINTCTDNISMNYYGWNPLCVTGPIVWGDSIIETFDPNHYFFGDSIELTPGYVNRNKSLVLPDGSIFALKKQASGGDLSALGATGTNNYNELWKNKNLYK